MGIFGAMAKAAGKEIKKSINRKLKQASGRPASCDVYASGEEGNDQTQTQKENTSE